MKFNPITKELFTNNNEFVKKLSCPYKINWGELKETTDNLKSRNCSNCNHKIIDTTYFSDNELLKMVTQNPDTCFKIDLDQYNLNLIPNGIDKQK
jgi:hypothetical protein